MCSVPLRPCPPPHPAPSRPAHALPANACDSHCHIFGPSDRYPYSATRAYTPEDMPVERLLALHEQLGVGRRVAVQASCHGTDNSAMLDALRVYSDTTRGVAQLADDVSDEELDEMNSLGVCGARFNFMARIQKAPEPAEIDKVIARVAPKGWHIVLHFDPDQLPGLMPWIESLDVKVVIDHCARLNAPDSGGPHHEAFLRLMERDNLWTKLSGVERGSDTGAPFDDMLAIHRSIAEVAPDRLVWGTDWPHPVLGKPMPDDGYLVDYLWKVVPDEAARNRILVDNPARLYGF